MITFVRSIFVAIICAAALPIGDCSAFAESTEPELPKLALVKVAQAHVAQADDVPDFNANDPDFRELFEKPTKPRSQPPSVRRAPDREASPQAVPRAAPPPAPMPGSRAGNGPPGMMGLPFPKSADEVPKTLSSLYAFLATEADKRQGGEIGGAIERLWRYAGSDTANLLIDRAEFFSMRNEVARGLPFADAAVDLTPEYAEAWSHRAYLHFRMQNYTAALGDLRRALAIEPNHFRALDALAKTLVLVGEKKAALDAYEKLLGIHPNIEGGQEARDALRKEVQGRGI